LRSRLHVQKESAMPGNPASHIAGISTRSARERELIARTREIVAITRRLAVEAAPDTFLGRKSYEPFPHSDKPDPLNSASASGWLKGELWRNRLE
jgi:hypothetical protein